MPVKDPAIVIESMNEDTESYMSDSLDTMREQEKSYHATKPSIAKDGASANMLS
jgi:hypothetical protein